MNELRSDLKAIELLRRNVSAILHERKESQADLAFAVKGTKKAKSWINKFINGTREIQMKDLDKIAAYFGIAAYQLFQPGVYGVAERRHGAERRSGRDRRIGHQRRGVASLTAIVASLRRSPREPDQHGANRAVLSAEPLTAEDADTIRDLRAEIDRLLAAQPGRSAPPARAAVAKTPPRDRPDRRAAHSKDRPA